jgi:hypothetical protein
MTRTIPPRPVLIFRNPKAPTPPGPHDALIARIQRILAVQPGIADCFEAVCDGSERGLADSYQES